MTRTLPAALAFALGQDAVGAAGSVLWLNDPRRINAVQKAAVEESRRTAAGIV